MVGKINYRFTAEIWQHAGGWCFASLPKSMSKEIRDNLKWQEQGWGRMKAFAQHKGVRWETSIWYDTKSESYALPIKAAIRKRSEIEVNSTITLDIWI